MKSGESRFHPLLFGLSYLLLYLCFYGCAAGDLLPGTRKIMLGSSVSLDCYPSQTTPDKNFYIVQWRKKTTPSPVLLWREGQASREGRGYEGRVSLLDRASLQIVDVRRTDKGLYECQMWDVNGHPLGNYTSSNIEVIDAIPRFIKQPTSILASRGGIAEFFCTTDPPADSVRWLHNGKMWNISEVTEPNDVLRFNISHHMEIREQLQGTFECVALWEMAALQSQSANLTIAGISPFKDQETITVTALEGGYVILPGSIPQSVPFAIPSVMHNGTLMEPLTTRRMLFPSGNLHIQGIQNSDAGWYQFSAKNPVTGEQVTSRNSVFLKVIKPEKRDSPQLLAAPKEANPIIVGDNVTLECAASGNPTPVVSWSKYGGVLPLGRYQQILGNLLLFDMQPNDTGTYICEVGNGIGFPISTIATVDVLDFPEIHKWTSEYEIREREEMVLECNTKMHSRPEIRWFFNGTLIDLTEDVILRDSKLIIKTAQRNHAGFYQCFVVNGAGMVSATARVRIVPRSAANEEVVVSGGNRKDHTIHLLDRSWDVKKNSSSLPENGSDQGKEGDFPISKKHKKGKKKGKKFKHVNGSSDNKVVMIPPTRPEVNKLSDESVMVRWDVPPNSGLPILFFKVQYKDVTKQNARWMTIDEDIAPHIVSYEVPNLRTGHIYRFRIAAVYSNNDNKLGPNSHKFVLQKDPPMKKPIVGPTIVHAEAVSPSAIMIRWQYLDQDEVPIDGFFIYYRTTTSAGAYTKVAVMGANTSSHILSYLLPDTAYDIKMQCFNRAGTSDFSNIRDEKTLPSAYHSGDGKSDNEETKAIHNIPTISDTETSDQLLYVVLGCVLGILTVLLLLFISYCSWKQRQRQHQQMQNKHNGNLRDEGKYVAINGTPANGHVGRGNGILLVDKPKNPQDGAFQETSLMESPPLTSNNNEDERRARLEDESDSYADSEVSECDQHVPTDATKATCEPLIHCSEEGYSSASDDDDVLPLSHELSKSTDHCQDEIPDTVAMSAS